MKKQTFLILFAVTLIPAGFISGFYLGGIGSRDPVQISRSLILRHPGEETAPQEPADPQTAAFPIDLNTAGPLELMTLPCIGEAFARRIIDYRDTHGGFSYPEELLNVEGITIDKFKTLSPFIITGGTP